MRSQLSTLLFQGGGGIVITGGILSISSSNIYANMQGHPS